MIYFNKNNQKLNTSDKKNTMYMQFESLSIQKSLAHMVFTRQGGVSEAPFKSLNASFDVGDNPEKVNKNLEIIRKHLNADQLIFLKQIHGTGIISFKKGDSCPPVQESRGDALITDIPCTALLVRQADCQGIILFDPERAVLAVVHSGWRGSALNIIGNTVKRMADEFECDPFNILAAAGPSLGPCCAEFVSYREIFPASFQKYMIRPDYFDLWKLSADQLSGAGLRRENIETSGICTKCSGHLFYSYRAQSITGRFATAAMIKGK